MLHNLVYFFHTNLNVVFVEKKVPVKEIIIEKVVEVEKVEKYITITDIKPSQPKQPKKVGMVSK